MTYSSPDSSYTQLCAVYRCRCGATHSGVGRMAGFLPRGWLRLSDTTCACPHCAEVVRAGKLPGLRAAP